MGKWVASQVLDGALEVIAGANRMLAVSGQPTDFAGAWSGRMAVAELEAADFAFAPGAGSGRRISVAAKIGLDALVSGSADHVALVDSEGERLLYVTTCPPQQLVPGVQVNFDGWSVEIGAPL